MNTSDFIDALQENEFWDTFNPEFTAYQEAENPPGDVEDQMISFFEDEKEITFTTEEHNDFISGHKSVEADTTAKQDIIIYQWWLLYKSYITGAGYC